MSFIITTLMIFNTFAFAMAFIFLFRNKVRFKSTELLILKVLGILNTFLVLYLAITINEWSEFQGSVTVILLFLSSLIFFAAYKETKAQPFDLAFSTEKPHRLLTSGIYSIIRHPFYTSYTLTWLAACLISINLAMCFLTTALIILYYRAANFEESNFLHSHIGPEYKAYQQRTGMFFPKIIRNNK